MAAAADGDALVVAVHARPVLAARALRPHVRPHLQYSTVQCSTVQYSTVQYSTVQYLETVFRVSKPPVTSTVAEEGSGMEQASLQYTDNYCCGVGKIYGNGENK